MIEVFVFEFRIGLTKPSYKSFQDLNILAASNKNLIGPQAGNWSDDCPDATDDVIA